MGEELGGEDRLWINELAEATGWSEDDIVDDLRNIDVDPSGRAEKYKELFERYYAEAKKRKEEGDTRQAGEKLWGAVVSLIKLCCGKGGSCNTLEHGQA